MGACSSKPKTTEFEGSTEPVKKAEDVVVERNTGAARASQENEHAKGKDGAVNAGDETEQVTHELIAHKDKAPVVKESSSAAEGASYSDERQLCAVDGGTGEGTVEKVGENVPDAQKVDVSDGIPEKDKEVSDKFFGDGGDAGGHQGEGEFFEDKAVVLNESSSSDVEKGGACTDKEVAAGEERAHESSSVVGSNTADESQNLPVAHQEARGIGSPIIGVVHTSEPHHVDDLPSSVSLEKTPQNTAPMDSTVSGSLDEASLASQQRSKDVVSPGEEVAVPQEALKEEEEVLHDDLKSTPPSVSAFNDGVVRKSEVDDANQGEEVPPASANVQDERIVEDTVKPDTKLVSQNDSEEKPSLPQEESVPVESASESPVAGMGNGGNSIPLDEPDLEAPKVHENIDEGTLTKPSAGTKAEEAGEGQTEGIVDEPNGTDVLPRDFNGEDIKPEASSTLASAEPIVEASSLMDRDETDKPVIEAATMNGEKVNDADAGIEETAEQKKKTPAEGDLSTFEDASDVPLKVEPSAEAGDRAA